MSTQPDDWQYENLVSAHELGKVLRGIRLSAGLTQTALSVQSGVSRTCIMRLEKTGKVNADHLFAILASLGASVDLRSLDRENTQDARRERLFKTLGYSSQVGHND